MGLKSASKLHKAIARTAVIESLEARTLLSVAIVDGTFEVVGSDGADDIFVSADAVFISVFQFSINGQRQFATLNGVEDIQITGGEGDDRITLDPSLDAMGYRATIDGGGGNDRISATALGDVLTGGDGDDTIYANAGKDTVYGGSGRDVIFAGAGFDYIDGSTGNDRIDAGEDDDTIIGGIGNDRIYGGAGADSIDGGKGDDFIDAGDGNDRIYDKYGLSIVYCGAGADTGYFGGEGTIFGGNDSDTIVCRGTAYVLGEAGNDTLTGTTVWGGDGNDTITGLDSLDHLAGDAGEAIIRGATGADELHGGDGRDALYGGDNGDLIYGDAGDDNLYGDDGSGSYDNEKYTGRDTGIGGAGSDWFQPTHRWAKIDSNKADGEKKNKKQ